MVKNVAQMVAVVLVRLVVKLVSLAVLPENVLVPQNVPERFVAQTVVTDHVALAADLAVLMEPPALPPEILPASLSEW